MTVGAFVKCAFVLILVLVLQVELFADLRVWGVMPEMLLGASIAGAWVAGPDRGAMIGFVSGMLYDIYLPTPLGLSALSYLLIAYGVGLIGDGVAQSGEATLRRLVTFIGVPLGMALFIVLGELLGEDLYGDGFTKLIIISTIYTLALLGPVHWLMRWAFAVDSGMARTPVRLEMVE